MVNFYSMLLKERLGLLNAQSSKPQGLSASLGQEKLILWSTLFEEAQSTPRRTFLFYC